MALLVFLNEIEDLEKLNKEYLPGALETLKGKADVLSADADCKCIEGKSPYPRCVILKFESEEAAKAWYDSKEYSDEVRAKRLNNTKKGFCICVKAMDLKIKPGAFLVFHNNIKDIEKLNKEYFPKAVETIGSYAIEAAALADKACVIEGNAPFGRIVVLAGKDAAELEKWYTSEAYGKNTLPMRLDNQEEGGFAVIAKAL
mmetsp:Transcript_1220/g.1768  ORF Transcript_1220/g.1768 Transcript_1220/m.1768 type:complete len:201 (-) Transcript_1220:127-729(-)|eukprot:jgi/Bigna1/86501/estExt_fgenesh1_pg.C_110047